MQTNVPPFGDAGRPTNEPEQRRTLAPGSLTIRTLPRQRLSRRVRRQVARYWRRRIEQALMDALYGGNFPLGASGVDLTRFGPEMTRSGKALHRPRIDRW